MMRRQAQRPDNLFAPELEQLAEALGIDLLPDVGTAQEQVPYVDQAGNILTNEEFDAIMRDVGVYDPVRLTDEEIDDILWEHGWLPDRYEDEPGWHSKTFDFDDKKTWPSPEELYEVNIEGFDPLSPAEGFLAIRYWDAKDGKWTSWQRVGKDPSTWDWAWPDADRFYKLLSKLKYRHKGNEYQSTTVQLRWLPYPTGANKARVMDGEENCAVAILRARYPGKAKALARIDAKDGFGEKQMWEASGILKLNMRLLDRLGGVMLETKKDGKWRYNGKTRHGTQVPPVDLYDYDGHALGSKPERPYGLTDDDVIVEETVGDYHTMKKHYGPNAIIWPAAEGYIVETGPKDRVVVRSAKVYEAIERRAKELGIAGTVLMSSPFSVEAEAWKKMNRFEPTPAALAAIWREANMYPRPYSAPTRAPGPSADVNSAYESAPTGGARDLFARYGFPRAEGQIVVKNPPVEILGETGLVVACLDLEKCHPWIRYQVKEPRGVYTTMRLQTWLDAGAIVIERIELAVIAQKYWPSLDRPAAARYSPSAGERWVPDPEKKPSYSQSKHWGREAIGRLVPNGDKHQDYVYVVDDSEAASVIQTLRKMGTLVSFSYEKTPVAKPVDERPIEEQIEDVLADLMNPAPADENADAEADEERERGGLWKIGFKTEGLPKTSCFHAHAYWLDYSAMVIDREVLRHPWEAIVRVATDSITLAQGHEFSEHVECEPECPGKWKKEKTPELREYGEPGPRPVPDLTELEKIAGPYWAPLCGSEPRMHILEGPPGFGKTFHCLERLAGHRYTVLTPTRKMRKKFVADGHKALTWRWALRPYAKFKPEGVRVPRGSLLYLPEIGTWPRGDIEVLVPWMLENGYRLLADGDREQMRPVKAEPPWAWLDSEPSVTIEAFTAKDYRSKTAELAALKMRLRGKPNAAIIDILRQEIGETDYRAFLEAWHPRDYVYACVHAARNVLHGDMTRMHKRKYPNEPVRIVYTEKDRQRSGEEDYIPLGAKIPELAELAYTTTYTSCQGETAGPDENGRQPRVWLVDARASEFFKGALYTGSARVEYIEQLGLVGNVPIPLTARELARLEYLYGEDDSDIIEID